MANAESFEFQHKGLFRGCANALAVLCLVTALAVYPLRFSSFLWLPCLFVSLLFGALASAAGSDWKAVLLPGLVIDGIYVVALIGAIAYQTYNVFLSL